ncbi:MAG: hypothetical protein RSE01_02300, partial [Akkermansia sp.]
DENGLGSNLIKRETFQKIYFFIENVSEIGDGKTFLLKRIAFIWIADRIRPCLIPTTIHRK